MDYDFRNKIVPPYSSQPPMYGHPAPSPSSSNPAYGPSMYPRVGQPGHGQTAVPPPARTSSYNQPSSHNSSASSGLGIKVTLKPEFRITPPPQLSPQMGDIPRSNFQFDFDLERKILAEAEKENQNWSKLGSENPPSKPNTSTSSMGGDPIVNKYIASGLNREAVPIAVANYGDNPIKVREFANGFTVLREMGFSSNSVADALFMHDSDTEKALPYLLASS